MIKIRKFLNNKKGLTLVEVLISIVILGIIAFSFISLFGTSFANIYSMGGKDIGMATASDIMEVLYTAQGSSGFESKQALEDALPAEAFNDNVEFVITENFNPYSDGTGQEGFKVSITVTYVGEDESRQVTLTSFFRGSDNND